MTIRDLQRHAVDTIKRHALTLSLASPRAQRHILTEYLWAEEGAEATALERVTSKTAPGWLDKLITRQLDDERRHAMLLRARLTELGVDVDSLRPPPGLVRAKLWWLERAVAPYLDAFAAGPIVVLLASAAQLEATGVRLFQRHLGVLEAHEAESRTIDPTAEVVRSILADEKRHAKSCAAAVERLVQEDERPALEALRERIAMIDRSFGVTIAVGYWLLIATHALRDRSGSAASATHVVRDRRAS